jgi:hypothetical protein
MLAWESWCSVTSLSVLGKGKACSSSSCTGELWINKACGARWVLSSPLRSAWITPPATSGWQQQITIHRTVSRLFFFLFALPTFGETTTELCLHGEKLSETVLHLNLRHFVGFFVCLFVLCGFGLFYFSPLMRQVQNNIWGTIPRIGVWGMNTKIPFELGDFF